MHIEYLHTADRKAATSTHWVRWKQWKGIKWWRSGSKARAWTEVTSGRRQPWAIIERTRWASHTVSDDKAPPPLSTAGSLDTADRSRNRNGLSPRPVCSVFACYSFICHHAAEKCRHRERLVVKAYLPCAKLMHGQTMKSTETKSESISKLTRPPRQTS